LAAPYLAAPFFGGTFFWRRLFLAAPLFGGTFFWRERRKTGERLMIYCAAETYVYRLDGSAAALFRFPEHPEKKCLEKCGHFDWEGG